MASTIRKIAEAVTPPIIYNQAKRVRDKFSQSSLVSKMAGRSTSDFDHRTRIGGLWDEVGKLQFDFLVNQGLQPDHKFLDIGCGSLRGGVHIIRYLDVGNYYGMDRDQRLLDAARNIELPQYELLNKNPQLTTRSDFDFSVFGQAMDSAIAQSVFTHLPWNTILRCLVNVRKVLKPGGRFFATYFEDLDGSHRTTTIKHNPGGIVTYPDADPFHYEFDVFSDLARRSQLNLKRIGPWDHPRNQMIMVFQKGGQN